MTVEISLQRPLKRLRSQHSIVDAGSDSSETRTQQPSMLTRWMHAQEEQRQSFLPAAIKANTRDVDESITEPESDLPDVKNTANAVDESVTEPESVEAQTPIEFTRYYEALLANEARLAQ